MILHLTTTINLIFETYVWSITFLSWMLFKLMRDMSLLINWADIRLLCNSSIWRIVQWIIVLFNRWSCVTLMNWNSYLVLFLVRINGSDLLTVIFIYVGTFYVAGSPIIILHLLNDSLTSKPCLLIIFQNLCFLIHVSALINVLVLS